MINFFFVFFFYFSVEKEKCEGCWVWSACDNIERSIIECYHATIPLRKQFWGRVMSVIQIEANMDYLLLLETFQLNNHKTVIFDVHTHATTYPISFLCQHFSFLFFLFLGGCKRGDIKKKYRISIPFVFEPSSLAINTVLIYIYQDRDIPLESFCTIVSNQPQATQLTFKQHVRNRISIN